MLLDPSAHALATSAGRYNRTARTLHWITAVLVIANIAIGLLHEPLEDVVRLIPLHKSIGMTVLGLTLARIAWRFTWHAPPLPRGTHPREAFVAKAVHALFYVLLLAMPVTGWIIASAGKYPLEWFGIIDLPKLAVSRSDILYELGREGHELLGWLFLALAILHIAAALRHHFLLRDNVLRRMM